MTGIFAISKFQRKIGIVDNAKFEPLYPRRTCRARYLLPRLRSFRAGISLFMACIDMRTMPKND
jgi:hypothetical protein